MFEGVCVEGVDVEGGRVTGVRTDQGDIECEVFVNCAGQVSHDNILVSIAIMNFCTIEHIIMWQSQVEIKHYS